MPSTSDDWPFISYDPTTYEPDGPAPPSLARRAATHTKTIVLTAAARTLALAVRRAGYRPARPPRVRRPVMGELALRVIDPAGLSKAQRSGTECALCRKRWPRPAVFFGCLQDGTAIRVCDDHDLSEVSA